MTRSASAIVCALLLSTGVSARAQTPSGTFPSAILLPPTSATDPTATDYVPITTRERVDWIVGGTVGVRSLTVVGPLAAGWLTLFNSPEEWGRTWKGVGQRYAQREADVAISNTLEGGLGALWGEDPRYIRSGRRGIMPRARYAMKTVLMAQRPDGHLAPAWGRYVGNTLNNVIENAWLPPSQTTAGSTAARSALGFASRLGGNLWEEFWPDVKARLRRK